MLHILVLMRGQALCGHNDSMALTRAQANIMACKPNMGSGEICDVSSFFPQLSDFLSPQIFQTDYSGHFPSLAKAEKTRSVTVCV